MANRTGAPLPDIPGCSVELDDSGTYHLTHHSGRRAIAYTERQVILAGMALGALATLTDKSPQEFAEAPPLQPIGPPQERPEPAPAAIVWRPHVPRSPRPIRVYGHSCCRAYEWCCEAGQFFVLREGEHGRLEEAGRGVYAKARQVWDELLAEHARTHI
ncbi:hypothetical protein AB0K40_17580 [Nonomuraea bangladeshensis]|uniref:Uncharacterized protein n=1 Tax=Nonomuraea bangladeshensis TaxID=404385 RepID=A0ABV3H466_9ACTN